jgi:hypothetical protein
MVLRLIPDPDAPAASPVGSAEIYGLERSVETSVQRIRRLQQEAHSLAREHVEDFARDLEAMAVRAAEIAEGGDAYKVGVRELASRIATDLPQTAQSMMAILGRAGRT